MKRRSFIGMFAGVMGALGLGRFMPQYGPGPAQEFLPRYKLDKEWRLFTGLSGNEQVAAGLQAGLAAPSRPWFRLRPKIYASPELIRLSREKWPGDVRWIDENVVPTEPILMGDVKWIPNHDDSEWRGS